MRRFRQEGNIRVIEARAVEQVHNDEARGGQALPARGQERGLLQVRGHVARAVTNVTGKESVLDDSSMQLQPLLCDKYAPLIRIQKDQRRRLGRAARNSGGQGGDDVGGVGESDRKERGRARRCERIFIGRGGIWRARIATAGSAAAAVSSGSERRRHELLHGHDVEREAERVRNDRRNQRVDLGNLRSRVISRSFQARTCSERVRSRACTEVEGSVCAKKAGSAPLPSPTHTTRRSGAALSRAKATAAAATGRGVRKIKQN